MEWLKYQWAKFKVNPYRYLYSKIGGRPWTYISRDIYHQVEYLILTALFIGGFALGKSGLVSWKWLLCILGAYTLGFIHGHFFWGKEYIEDEQGE